MKFKIISGKILITDPCYEIGSKGTVLVPAVSGDWTIDIIRKDRVNSHLYAFINGSKITIEKNKTVYVDSGQIGLFDPIVYNCVTEEINNLFNCITDPIDHNNRFYSVCCNLTMSQNDCGVIQNGFVTSSGLGDGAYPVHLQFNQFKECIRIQIRFI